MRKNVTIVLGFMLLLLASCSPKSEYTHALPKNASLVVAVDWGMLADKAQLQGKEGVKLTDKLVALLQGGLEGEAARLAEKIVKKPSESGLNFAAKAYLFATPHANAFGLLMKVDSENKVEDVLNALHEQQICSDIRQESGCRWVQMGKSLCAFNKGTFLWMQNRTGDVENIKGTAFMLMRQQEGEGFDALSDFVLLKEEGNDVASMIDLSILPDRLTTPLRMGLSGDIRLQDIKYLVTTNFEHGRMKMDFRSLTSNKKVQTFYQEMDKVTSVIQGKYMDYFPANTFAWLGGRIQGKAFFDRLYQNPTLRQQLLNPELPVDMKRIFSAVEGDIAVGYLSVVSDAFLAYADVTHSDFLETFEELRPLLALTGGQVQLYDTAENQYALKTMDGIYWFGVKGGFLYITNRMELAEEAGRTYGVSVGTRPWSADMKANRVSASVNFARLATDMKEYPYFLSSVRNPQVAMIVKLLASELEVMNVSMPNWSEGQIELLMKDKKTNPLQLAVQILNNL